MSELLRLDGIRKSYPLPGEPRSLVGRLIRAAAARSRTIEALRGVSLAIRRGEGVAILGPNGSGKSTLLRVAAGITTPSAGSIATRGRVAAVLGVGAGFHPELTGRENLYMNAVLHGLTLAETRVLADRIIEFAGIREFIEAPVRAYSDGMLARLGIAIAIHLSYDILIVDETLSVGDLEFVQRCRARIAEIRGRRDTAFLFATHSLEDAALTTDRALLLRHGTMVLEGPTPGVIEAFQRGTA